MAAAAPISLYHQQPHTNLHPHHQPHLPSPGTAGSGISQVAGGGYTPPIAHLGSVPSASGGYPEIAATSSQSISNQLLIHHSSLQIDSVPSEYCVDDTYVKHVARVTPMLNSNNTNLIDFCEDENFIKQIAQLYHDHCRCFLLISEAPHSSSTLNDDEIVNLYTMVNKFCFLINFIFFNLKKKIFFLI